MRRLCWLIPPLILAVVTIVWLWLPTAVPASESGVGGPDLGAPTAEVVGSGKEFWEDNEPEDFVLAGLTLWATGSEVRAKLGRAERVEKRSEPSPHEPGTITIHWETWYYPGLELSFVNSTPRNEPRPADPGNLWHIKAVSAVYPTARGVSVGDSLELVFARYGEIGPTDGWYYYLGATEDLAFHAPAGTVKEIVVLAEVS